METYLTALVVIASIAFMYRQGRRERRQEAEFIGSIGAELYRLNRPLLRSPIAWNLLLVQAGLLWVNAEHLTRVDGFEFWIRLLAVIILTPALVGSLYSLWKREAYVFAVLGENGILFLVPGPSPIALASSPTQIVPWNSIKRWTWSRTPALQLNLCYDQAIHSVWVNESDRESVENILQQRTALAAQMPHSAAAAAV